MTVSKAIVGKLKSIGFSLTTWHVFRKPNGRELSIIPHGVEPPPTEELLVPRVGWAARDARYGTTKSPEAVTLKGFGATRREPILGTTRARFGAKRR